MQECRFKCHTVCSNKKWIHLSNRQLITIIKGGGYRLTDLTETLIMFLWSCCKVWHLPFFFFCNSQWRMYSAVSCTYTGARHPTKWGHWKTYPFMATFSQYIGGLIARSIAGVGKELKKTKGQVQALASRSRPIAGSTGATTTEELCFTATDRRNPSGMPYSIRFIQHAPDPVIEATMVPAEEALTRHIARVWLCPKNWWHKEGDFHPCTKTSDDWILQQTSEWGNPCISCRLHCSNARKEAGRLEREPDQKLVEQLPPKAKKGKWKAGSESSTATGTVDLRVMFSHYSSCQWK